MSKLLPPIDFTRERLRKATRGLPAIEQCPRCGKRGLVRAVNGRRHFAHVEQYEDVGGMTITHTREGCWVAPTTDKEHRP